MRSSRLVVLVAVMLVAVGVVGSGAVLSTPAVAQAPATSGICDSEGVAQFSDVADSDYAAAYILCMRALGLSQGRSGGDYGPDRGLNRGQMASFLIRLWTDQLGQQCPTEVVVPFTDTAGTTHEANIECLFGLGITQGTSATTYGPQDPLKASQISRFLYRTYEKAGGDQCAGTAGSELVRASECLFSLRVVPSQAEATAATPVVRSQMGVYVIGLWHNLTGKGLPPTPPQLGAATPSTTTTTTQPVVTPEPATVDGAGIWVINADGTGLKRILASAVDWDTPVWSPDGSRIAYSGSSDGVWVVNADGTNPNQIAISGGANSSRSARWSPDGTRIAYAHDGVWVVGADGTNRKQVASDVSWGWAPVWSPDGSRIAYVDDGVWVVGADGTNRKQVASDVSWGWAPVWSPDGSRIAYVDDGVWVVDADGTNAREIASGGVGPVWSPDGTRIAYHGTGVWVVGADGANPKQIVSDSIRVGPVWSPDGTRIAYTTYDGVWVVGADGTNPKQIGSDGGTPPVWFRIAYTTYDGVWVVGADGTNPKQIATAPRPDLATFWAAWSPDGTRIAFSVAATAG